MSRSIKKYAGYAWLCGFPQSFMKKFAARSVRNYKYFEYVSNGGWYKKAFNSDHIHEGTTIIYGEYKLQKKIIKDILWRQSTNNNSIINDDKYHCHIYYRLKGK